MICVGCFLLYLAIVKEFEPLILLPMAFGMILANLPGSGVIHMQYFVGDGLEPVSYTHLDVYKRQV